MFNPIPVDGRNEMVSLIIEDLKKSGFFKPEKLPKLESHFKKMIKQGVYSEDPFNNDDLLSLEEKKKYGFKKKKKISKDLINFLTETGLSQKNPEDLLSMFYNKYFFIICRKYDLIKMKKEGVKKVKICGSPKQVCVSMDLEKIWPIDEVPELPFPNCTNFYCPCSYLEVYEQ